MAKKKQGSSKSTQEYKYCALPQVAKREFSPSVGPDRANLILNNSKKWVNGTVLHYYFFTADDTRLAKDWGGTEAEKDVVRNAFEIWKNLGIGLEFKETNLQSEAEIRIGFLTGDGSWSYIGRDNLLVANNQRTMNFGWDLTLEGEIDTALHEIGHAMGFPHEHQNPNAGIEWNKEAVYTALAKPPNNWDRDKTHHNIIRKIDAYTVKGSMWDPDSIMHYPFEPELINAPEPHATDGINPAPGLSTRDKVWVRAFYKPLNPEKFPQLRILESVKLAILEGEQSNYIIEPDATRDYTIQTFGTSDTVMVLFEEVNGIMRYVQGDDDSGEDRNASITWKLFQGRRYIIRIRLFFENRTGETAVMLW